MAALRGGPGALVTAAPRNDHKAALRQHFRAARHDLAQADRAAQDAATSKQLEQCLTDIATAAGHPMALAAFMPLPGEAGVSPLIASLWASGHEVWLPRCLPQHQLSWHAVSSENQLHRGRYGIREPNPDLLTATTLPSSCVIAVPGVAFDATGQRLGQGAGYYDRAMAARQPGQRWIGIGYANQVATKPLPCDEHDQELDAILVAGSWLKTLGPYEKGSNIDMDQVEARS